MLPSLDISILIPTLNRAASLQVTLQCLGEAVCDDVAVEVVVIDNGSTDDTRRVVETFAARINARYLYQPSPIGVYGKSHALNRALDRGALGSIIAVLDDDMSPHPGWIEGVRDICRRWPEKDIFTGRSYVIWPSGPVPAWATDARIHSWAFSVVDQGDRDAPLEKGRWYPAITSGSGRAFLLTGDGSRTCGTGTRPT